MFNSTIYRKKHEEDVKTTSNNEKRKIENQLPGGKMRCVRSGHSV
jgi:hypothetical protein